MNGKCLQNMADSAKIERPDTVLVTPSGPNHSDPEKEDRPMADYGQYTDSARAVNPEQSDNWKSIGGLARKSLDNALAARADRAAREAVAKHRAEVGDNSSFGYAYVYVPKEHAHIFRGAFPQRGGFCMLDWSGAGGLLTHEEIAAEAFCNVLKAEGVNAFWNSRVD